MYSYFFYLHPPPPYPCGQWYAEFALSAGTFAYYGPEFPVCGFNCSRFPVIGGSFSGQVFWIWAGSCGVPMWPECEVPFVFLCLHRERLHFFLAEPKWNTTLCEADCWHLFLVSSMHFSKIPFLAIQCCQDDLPPHKAALKRLLKRTLFGRPQKIFVLFRKSLAHLSI